MNHTAMLLIGFVAFYLPAFGLYHLMVFRVNQQLPSDRRISAFPLFRRVEQTG